MDLLTDQTARDKLKDEALRKFKNSVYLTREHEMQKEKLPGEHQQFVPNDFFEKCYKTAKAKMISYIGNTLKRRPRKSSRGLINLEMDLKINCLRIAKLWFEEFFLHEDAHMRVAQMYMTLGQNEDLQLFEMGREELMMMGLGMVEETAAFKARRERITTKYLQFPEYDQQVQDDREMFKRIMKGKKNEEENVTPAVVKKDVATATGDADYSMPKFDGTSGGDFKEPELSGSFLAMAEDLAKMPSCSSADHSAHFKRDMAELFKEMSKVEENQQEMKASIKTNDFFSTCNPFSKDPKYILNSILPAMDFVVKVYCKNARAAMVTQTLKEKYL